MTSEVYINIGSNNGDRHAIIGKAVALLSKAFKTLDAHIKVSEPIETAPWGFVSDNSFVNVGVLVSFESALAWTPQKLEKLYEITSGIEHTISAMPHRNPDGTYCDREIDIDIIFVDELTYNSDTLTIPHPRMALRDFVLIPLRQLMPQWQHPISGLTAQEMLQKLNSDI